MARRAPGAGTGATEMVGSTVAPPVPGSVRVLRPVRVRQVSAGLAVGAAVAGLLSLALSLDTTRFFFAGDEEPIQSFSRMADGGVVGDEDAAFDRLAWSGPTVLAVVLLVVAATAAVLAARTDRPGGWGSAAQQLAAGAAGLLVAATGVMVVFAASDVSAYEDGEGIVTRWGPAPAVLGAAAVLAVAAAVTARRGRAAVLATIGAGDAS